MKTLILKRFKKQWLLACMAFIVSMGSAQALQLSAAQLQLVQQMPAAEKAKLAQQAGLSSKAAGANTTTITPPANIPSRTPKTGGVEQQARQLTADQKQTNAKINASMTSAVPIAQVGSQQGADNLETRQSFANFVAESKPLTVNTSDLKQFGYDLFSGSPSTFAPVTDVPVPAEYVLGPGDELKVQLFGSSNQQFSLLVDRTGEVSFPNLGPIVLAKLTFSEAKALLAQEIARKMVGVSASISMGKLRSIRIFALGEVFKPGSYVVSGLATLSQALMASGGVNKTGTLRRVQLKRRGHVVATIDLYDFLLKGDTSKDVRLLPGDVVFVPPIGATVSIAGAVLRPAIYELRKASNVGDLLHLSGGLLPQAFIKKALLEGLNAHQQRYVKDLALEGRGLKEGLHNGDLVKVFSTLDFEKNPVYLIGNVKRPGKYAWKKGMHLSDLISKNNDLLPETYMKYAVIEREAKGNREPEMVRFNLKGLFHSGANAVDIELKARDKIYVFNRSHFRVAPKASIVGSVKSPGEYALKKNMTILDLVMASGGLTRDSLMSVAELYRTNPVNKKVKVLHVTLSKIMKADPTSDLLLQDLDRVVVHSIWGKRYKEVVSIQGEVKNSGEYPRAQNMHVSDLIFAVNGLTRDTLIGDAQLYRTNDKTKEVSLLTFDVGKALQGDVYSNPLLQDLDRVVVHSIWEKRYKEVVSIQGEVKNSGEYPRAQNMHVSDFIFAANGLTRDTLIGDAQIYRTNDKTKEVSLLTFDVGKALQGDVYSNPLLQDLDRVVVHSIWEEKKRSQVRVLGEVKKPGEYLLADGLHISDLIFAAGNVSEKAYMKQVELTRYTVVDGDKRVSKHLNIDLQAALHGDKKANLELQPYDTLYVRKLTNWRDTEQVVIRGEVLFPGTYPIEDGEHLSSLLKRAGGYTDKAYLRAGVFTRETIRKEQQKKIDLMAKKLEAEIARLEGQAATSKDPKALAPIASAKAMLEQMKKTKATGRLVIALKDLKRLKKSGFDVTLHDGDSLYIPKRPGEVLVMGQVYNNTAMLYQKKLSVDDYISRNYSAI